MSLVVLIDFSPEKIIRASRARPLSGVCSSSISQLNSQLFNLQATQFANRVPCPRFSTSDGRCEEASVWRLFALTFFFWHIMLNAEKNSFPVEREEQIYV
jgi:hypothetical protein